ncbi:hypothetical protein E4U21_000315 [Claviceps maximensis]|nr:hypothetical protein E4U21_000315 [Claviceps maximensis]
MPGIISIRKSIRWIPGPEDASEPTSTMVLTSPGGKFVDVRVLKAGDGDGDLRVLPPSRLDWAIAGTSSSQVIRIPTQDQNKTTTIRRCRFEHWVDSRASKASPDEGDMYPQEDGTTLEKGRMVNPDTGMEMDYEEVWWDEEHDVPRECLAGAGSGTGQECVVLRHEGEGEGEDTIDERRGMVVRLAGHAQGFVKVGGEMAIGRWSLVKEEEVVGDEAERKRPSCVVSMGRMDWLPGEDVLVRRFAVGETLWVGGLRWEVVEVA